MKLIDPATEIANFVFEHWPVDWQATKVNRAEVLRFIYQGRFLHENVTLECKWTLY